MRSGAREMRLQRAELQRRRIANERLAKPINTFRCVLVCSAGIFTFTSATERDNFERDLWSLEIFTAHYAYPEI